MSRVLATQSATLFAEFCFPRYRERRSQSIKIDGVLHEFSTIPGVKEDTTELILNLRELYVQMDVDGAEDG